MTIESIEEAVCECEMWTLQGLDYRLRAVIKAQTTVQCFSLRRCRASYATSYQGDVADVQAVLGHSAAEMTLAHYRRAIPERMLVAADELERRMGAGKMKGGVQ